MKKFQDRLFLMTRYFEIVITIAVMIAIGITMSTLFVSLKELFTNVLDKSAFEDFLKIAFNILIGIEFLKMIIKYNVDTVIEVLLFAIARQLIVEHTTIYQTLIGIISIAILFGIRKYFFIPKIDNDKKDVNDIKKTL